MVNQIEGGDTVAKVTELTAELAGPIVAGNGCTLWDVEYVKEAGAWYLRVYIDKAGGVSIDDCEALKAYENGDVTVELPGGDVTLEKKDVAQVRLHVAF